MAEKEKVKDLTPTHAGLVILNLNQTRVLGRRLSVSNNQTLWLLPKGHIEKDEINPDETARREAKEEVGWQALDHTLHYLGQTPTYLDDEGKEARVAWFASFTGIILPERENEVEWIKADQLTYDDQRLVAGLVWKG